MEFIYFKRHQSTTSNQVKSSLLVQIFHSQSTNGHLREHILKERKMIVSRNDVQINFINYVPFVMILLPSYGHSAVSLLSNLKYSYRINTK